MKFVVEDVDAKVPLAERVAYASAQQRQLREDFAAAWDGLGLLDEVRAATPDHLREPGEVPIRLVDRPPASVKDALAIHDRLADGTPVAYVYVGLLRGLKSPWTSAASHEVLELRGDPRLHACVEFDDGTVWDREVCDRVEEDCYAIDGVALSNFNTPAAFEPSGAPNELFDHLGLSKKANEVRPGGYAQRYDSGKGWTMVGEMSAYRAHVARLGIGRVRRRAARAARGSLLDRALRALGLKH